MTREELISLLMTYEVTEEYYKGFLAGQEHEKRPKAKWIPYESHEIRTCDRCKIPRVSYELTSEMKYCWGCGAEMESEK